MNPAKLGKPGSRTHITWVGWVQEPIEPSCVDLDALTKNPANPAKTWQLLICFNEPC